MKNIILKMAAFLAVVTLSSCAQKTYYQLVNTKPVGNLQKTDNAVVYEDANCKISYDLWSEGGSTKITFQNKTDEDICLDLGASFYFMNNQAFDLYNGATTSNSTTVSRGGSVYWGYGISTAKNTTNNSTIVTQQQQLIIIPAEMYKVINETDVTVLSQIYRDCNLYLAPSKKAVTSSNFNQNDSPFTFGLRLTYYVGKSIDPIKVRNEFYVNSITNYPAKQFKESYTDKSYACPDETVLGKSATNYNYLSPEAFFLKYNPALLGGGTGSSRKH